jgi:flagellin
MKLNNSVVVQQSMNDLSSAHLDMNRHLEKISRGERITKAKDDAAALAVAENLDAQTRSLVVAGRNINDGIAMLDVLHDGISQMGEGIKRIRELTIQASSETLAQDERNMVAREIDEETRSLLRIARLTNWDETPAQTDQLMLFGPISSVDVQAGANGTTSDRIAVDTFDAGRFWLDDGGGVQANQIFYNINASTHPGASGLLYPDKPINEVHAFDLSDAEGAQKAIDKVEQQLNFINNSLANNGASRNKLSRALSHVQNQGVVLNGSKSRMRDADFAIETANLVKSKIRSQSSTAILAQANRMNEGALRLLN